MKYRKFLFGVVSAVRQQHRNTWLQESAKTLGLLFTLANC